jgi:hypothetical protein
MTKSAQDTYSSPADEKHEEMMLEDIEKKDVNEGTERVIVTAEDVSCLPCSS